MSRIKHPQLVAMGIEPLTEGERFKAWPLHITVLPWFEGARQKQLNKDLARIAASTPLITVEVSETAWFGVKRDVPVRTIEENYRLRGLHVAVLNSVYQAGGKVIDPSYISYKYNPHITVSHDEDVLPAYELGGFAVVSDLGGVERQVEKVYEFGR